MGYTDQVKEYQAKDNDEQKLLTGDCVAVVKKWSKFHSEKKGMDYISMEAEVINVIEPKPGKENNIVPGDKIKKIYTPSDDKSLKKLMDDLFTANIQVDKSSDEVFEASLAEKAPNTLIYFRCWVNEETDKETKQPTGRKFQNVAIKTYKMLTPENSTPQLPF